MAGPQKDHWTAQRYNTNANFVYSNAAASAVVSLLDPKPGEKILDLGCGSGELTMRLADIVVSNTEGEIVGVDLSKALLAQAEVNANGRDRVSLQHLDGHDLDTLEQASFDAVFSNAAMHWMSRDPLKVAQGAYHVLRSGGRFVSEMGGAYNVAGVRAELYASLRQRGHSPEQVDPFWWPTVKQQTRILEQAGFTVETCELVPRITPLPTGLSGWLETFAFAWLDVLDTPEERAAVIKEVCDRLEVDMKTEDGWTIIYTRLRFRAMKAS